jgi:50S ribosomal protein L16 3-hydroxylase
VRVKTQHEETPPSHAADRRRHGLLGKVGVQGFLSRYWQKRPLLVRSAIPGFEGIADRDALFRLAGRDDVESRLVQKRRERWSLVHGPISASQLRRMPVRNWTLLVQGVNHHVPAADRLLRSFSFIPYARLDDIMVSYAAPGGGVGPHLDSYDVFLLQSGGARIWRIGRPRSAAGRELVPGAPLKQLKHFTPEAEYLLEPGDMLYLPPGWAHDGVALEAGMTCSVGFRAPSRRELVAEFLTRFAERLDIDGLYGDPGLKRTRHPAEVPAEMIRATEDLLARTRFSRAAVADFLGEYLSEPKAQVIFDPPQRALPLEAFARTIRRVGVRLDPRSILLFQAGHFYLNGERTDPTRGTRATLLHLAGERSLPASPFSDGVAALLHGWYLAGWLHTGQNPR